MIETFAVGDRVRYRGSHRWLGYARGVVTKTEDAEYIMMGVLCRETRVSIQLDGGHHTITTATPEHEWRRLNPLEWLAEIA